jgi:hypothetical protein
VGRSREAAAVARYAETSQKANRSQQIRNASTRWMTHLVGCKNTHFVLRTSALVELRNHEAGQHLSSSNKKKTEIYTNKGKLKASMLAIYMVHDAP